MASLIESNASSVAEFKATLDSADRLTSLLYGGYGDDEVSANPQQSSLITLDDDLWRELYLLPTPPLSPEGLENVATVHPSTTPTQTTQSVASEIAPGNTDLFVDMLGYDQMMDVLEEAERVLTDSQQAHQQDLLLQDCMWSGGGGNSDGLLLGSINTAANPSLHTTSQAPTDSTSVMNSDPTLQCTDSTGPDTQSVPMDDTHCSNDSDAEPDCVEPSAVFPVLRSSETTHKMKPTRMPSCSLRSNSSGSSSESEEEIDVVTVERSSHDHLPSGKSSILSSHGSSTAGGHHHRYSSSSSKKQLSGSSKHSSSISSSSIRKKRHTKKISRRSSEDGAESDEEARRASHNVLERKRRNDLKNSFDILRGCIPELEENLRAPKVVILRKSVEYISSLQSTEQRTKVEFNKEQARYKKLAERLSLLRNSVVTC